MKAASEVWCKLPKKAPAAGRPQQDQLVLGADHDHANHGAYAVAQDERRFAADAVRNQARGHRGYGTGDEAYHEAQANERYVESSGQQVQVEEHRERAVDHVHADYVQHVQVGVAAELARSGHVVAGVALGRLGQRRGNSVVDHRCASSLRRAQTAGRANRSGRASGAGDGNRTHVACLEGTGSTIELLPRSFSIAGMGRVSQSAALRHGYSALVGGTEEPGLSECEGAVGCLRVRKTANSVVFCTVLHYFAPRHSCESYWERP